MITLYHISYEMSNLPMHDFVIGVGSKSHCLRGSAAESIQSFPSSRSDGERGMRQCGAPWINLVWRVPRLMSLLSQVPCQNAVLPRGEFPDSRRNLYVPL